MQHILVGNSYPDPPSPNFGNPVFAPVHAYTVLLLGLGHTPLCEHTNKKPLTSVVSGTKGRCQNSSVASGDFLQRMTKVGWKGFAAQLQPYHMLD